MAYFTFANTRIAGISACVPENVFDNNSYDLIDEKERRTLIKTIGVEKKRFVSKGMLSSDLCYHAAVKLIEELKWDREEIDLLVFVSQTRDYLMPATACILQDRLKLSKNCLAFDVDMGCSGYIYGLSVISGLMSSGQLRKALLLTGEIPSPNISYKDKSTFPLFGDAGAATAVEYKTAFPESCFNLQTDGSGHKAIHIPDGGMKNYPDPETTFKEEKIAEGIIRNRAQIALDGMAVFNFSLREVAPNVKKLLNKASLSVQDIDYFVFHQANRIMNETIRKQLKVEPEKYLYSLKNFGNTSSASIPLTIVTEMDRQKIKEKSLKVLMSGFGVGLSWGSCIVEFENVVCPELVQIS